MSHRSRRIRREHAALTLMAAGALLAAGGISVVVLFDRSVLVLGGFALTGALLWLFGYRTMLEQRARARPTGGYAARWPVVERSGHVAFWVLLAVILVDSVWHVVPVQDARIAYAYAGCLAALAAFAHAVLTE